MVPPSADATSGTYLQHQLVRIYLLVGEREGARPARAVAQDPVLPLAQLAQDRYHLRPAPGQPAVRTIDWRGVILFLPGYLSCRT